MNVFDKQKAVAEIKERAEQYSYSKGDKVYITPIPEYITVGTIKTDEGIIQICYDPMLPPDSWYIMDKNDFERNNG